MQMVVNVISYVKVNLTSLWGIISSCEEGKEYGRGKEKHITRKKGKGEAISSFLKYLCCW